MNIHIQIIFTLNTTQVSSKNARCTIVLSEVSSPSLGHDVNTLNIKQISIQ